MLAEKTERRVEQEPPAPHAPLAGNTLDACWCAANGGPCAVVGAERRQRHQTATVN
jgi:hypothetical protein